MPGNIVINGAASGMARALAGEMHKRGYPVGAAGKRDWRFALIMHISISFLTLTS